MGLGILVEGVVGLEDVAVVVVFEVVVVVVVEGLVG